MQNVQKKRPRLLRVFAVILAFSLVLLNVPIIALGYGNVYYVYREDDVYGDSDNDLSLRQAVEKAEDGDTVILLLDKQGQIKEEKYYLKSELEIKHDIKILGKCDYLGDPLTQIVGFAEETPDDRHRIIKHTSGGNLTIENIRLEYGRAPAGNDATSPDEDGGKGEDGGAILSNGTVTLKNCGIGATYAGKGGDGANGTAENPNGSSGGSGGKGGGIYAKDAIYFEMPSNNYTASGTVASEAGDGGRGGSAANSAALGGTGGTGGDGGVFYSDGPIIINGGYLSGCGGRGGNGGAGSGNGGVGGNGGVAYSGTSISVSGKTMITANTSGGSAGGNGGEALASVAGGNGGNGGNGGAFYCPGKISISATSYHNEVNIFFPSKVSGDGGNGGYSEAFPDAKNGGNSGNGGFAYSKSEIIAENADIVGGEIGGSGFDNVLPSGEYVYYGHRGNAGDGAGLYSETLVTVKNSKVFENTAFTHYLSTHAIDKATNGVGLYSEGNVNVESSTFTNNKTNERSFLTVFDQDSGHGGAIYARGDVTIVGSTFENNQAVSVITEDFVGHSGYAGKGGAVYVGGKSSIVDSHFISNEAGYISVSSTALASYAGDGGALYFVGDATVINCEFKENSSGGGKNYVFNDGTYGANLTHGGKGGAIYAENRLEVDRGTFFKNKTGDTDQSGHGGAIYSEKLAYIYNSSFVENEIGHKLNTSEMWATNLDFIDGGGAGAALFSEGELVLVNSTVGNSISKLSKFYNYVKNDESLTGSTIASTGKVTLIHTTVAGSQDAFGVAVSGDGSNIVTLNSYSGGHTYNGAESESFVPNLPVEPGVKTYLAGNFSKYFKSEIESTLVLYGDLRLVMAHAFIPENDGLNGILGAKPATADTLSAILPDGVEVSSVLSALNKDIYGEDRKAKLGNVVTFGSLETDYVAVDKWLMDIEVSVSEGPHYVGFGKIDFVVIGEYNTATETLNRSQFDLYLNGKIVTEKDILASAGEKVITIVPKENTSLSAKVTVVVRDFDGLVVKLNGVESTSYEFDFGEAIEYSITLHAGSEVIPVRKFESTYDLSIITQSEGVFEVLIVERETTSGFSKSFTVKVSKTPTQEPELAIYPTFTPNKNSYLVGEKLDVEVRAVYTDEFGNSHNVDSSLLSFNRPLADITQTAGDHVIYASYNDCSAQFSVKVASWIRVSNTKDTYYRGQSLDVSKLTVELVDDIENPVIIKDFSLSPAKNYVFTAKDAKNGYCQFELTTEHAGKPYANTFKVSVKEPAIEKIVVDTSQMKTDYIIGEKLNFSGLRVVAHYVENAIEPEILSANQYAFLTIDDNPINANDFTLLQPLEIRVVLVSDINFSDKFDVNVLVPDGIKLVQSPKTQYFEYDNLDLSDLKAVFTFSKSPETFVDCKSVATSVAHGTQMRDSFALAVTASDFDLNLSCTVDISVAKLVGISAAAQRESYVLGDAAPIVTVAGLFEGDLTKKISDYNLSPELSSITATAGLKTLKASYKGFDSSFNVKVVGIFDVSNSKSQYYHDEKLDTSLITATIKNSVFSAAQEVDFSINPDPASGFNAVGQNSYTVSFSENGVDYSKDISVNVVTRGLASILVLPPTKTVYLKGELLDLAGLKVSASFDGNVTTSLNANEYTLSHNNGHTLDGDVEVVPVVVTLNSDESKTASFNIRVKQPIGIKVTKPIKTEYFVGERLNLSGMSVVYSFEGTDVTMPCSDYSTTPGAGAVLSVDNNSVTVTSGRFVESFAIVVKRVESNPYLTVEHELSNENPVVGEGLSVTLKVTYTDKFGEKHVIKSADYTSSHDLLKLTNTSGSKTVTITYDGVSDSFSVIVIPKLIATSNKSSYNVGERIAGNDFSVKILTDISKEPVAVDFLTSPAVGYLFSSQDAQVGSKDITVSANSGGASISTVFTVDVVQEDVISGLSASGYKDSFYKYDQLDLSGLKVTANYSGGTQSHLLNTSEYTVTHSGSSNILTGDITVTVTLKANTKITTSFTISVKQPAKIIVTTRPTKFHYTTGDKLDYTGMVISYVFEDNFKKVCSDYTTDLPQNTVLTNTSSASEPSAYTATISSPEGLRVELGFLVYRLPKDFDLFCADVNVLPKQDFYWVGDQISITVENAVLTYDMTFGYPLDDDEYVLIDREGNPIVVSDITRSAGTKYVRVAYVGNTNLFMEIEIVVKEKPSELVLVSAPLKTSYAKGEHLLLNGLKVSLNAGGSHQNVELSDLNFTIDGSSVSEGTRLMSEGQHTVVVHLNGKSVSFTIHVGAKKVVDVKFSSPTKNQFNKGERFVLDGILVTVTYSDDSVKTYTEKNIGELSVETDPFNLNARLNNGGKYSVDVKITVDGQVYSHSYNIEVLDKHKPGSGFNLIEWLFYIACLIVKGIIKLIT